MDKQTFLLTLEVDPLQVGTAYNPLPAHLTLMSRFRLAIAEDEVIAGLTLVFKPFSSIKLLFSKKEIIGPNQTVVFSVRATEHLTSLHEATRQYLQSISADFLYPEFIGSAWRPHVSVRNGTAITPDSVHISKAIYLHRVISSPHGSLRHCLHTYSLDA